MNLDKIRFARLIGYISAVSGRDFAPDEVNYIDRIVDVECEARPIGTSPDRLNDLLALMQESNSRIEAIKVYRELTGMGLKESKDAIEKYWHIAK